jgi:hypothetical protein
MVTISAAFALTSTGKSALTRTLGARGEGPVTGDN